MGGLTGAKQITAFMLSIFFEELPSAQCIEYMGGMAMSYRIEYGKDHRYRIPGNRRKWGRIITVLSIIVAGVGLGFCAVQQIGLEGFLPGDPVITGAALDNLVESWRNGVPAGEAFTVFCEEIVAHAQIIR